MRMCVNCGLSYSDHDRFCARCGYILREKPVSFQPSEVIESRVSRPVEFVSSRGRTGTPRPHGGYSALLLGLFFILAGLLLGFLFLCPFFIGDFAGGFGSLGGKFGSLGGKLGQLGGELGSLFGSLGGKFGQLGGDFGRTFGHVGGHFGSSFGPRLRWVLLIFLPLFFLVPGVLVLVHVKRRGVVSHSQR